MFYIRRILLLSALVLHSAELDRGKMGADAMALERLRKVQMLNQTDLWILDALDCAQENADAMVSEEYKKGSDVLIAQSNRAMELETGNMRDDSAALAKKDDDLALFEDWMQFSDATVLDRFKYLLKSSDLTQVARFPTSSECCLPLDSFLNDSNSASDHAVAPTPNIENFATTSYSQPNDSNSASDHAVAPTPNIENFATTSYSQPKKILINNDDQQEEKVLCRKEEKEAIMRSQAYLSRESREIEKVLRARGYLEPKSRHKMYCLRRKQKRVIARLRCDLTQGVRNVLSTKLQDIEKEIDQYSLPSKEDKVQMRSLRKNIRKEWRKKNTVSKKSMLATKAPNMDRQARKDVERVHVLSEGHVRDHRHHKTGVATSSKKVSEFTVVNILERGESSQSVKPSLLNNLICLREWSRQNKKYYAAKKQGNKIQNPVPKAFRYDRFNLLVRELNLHTDESVFDSSFMDRVNDNLKIRDSARKKVKVRTVEELDKKLSQRVSREKDTDETSETLERLTDASLLKEALESEMTYLSHRREIMYKSQAKQRSVVEDERVVEEGMEVDSEPVVDDVCDDLMDESALIVCPQSGSHMRNVESEEELLGLENAEQGTGNASLVDGSMSTDVDNDPPSEENRDEREKINFDADEECSNELSAFESSSPRGEALSQGRTSAV